MYTWTSARDSLFLSRRRWGRSFIYRENPSQTLYTSKIIEGPGIYYIGVIDYLQKYNIKKKLERFWKVGIRCKDKTAISDMPPIQYRDRIIEKIMNKVRVVDRVEA